MRSQDNQYLTVYILFSILHTVFWGVARIVECTHTSFLPFVLSSSKQSSGFHLYLALDVCTKLYLVRNIQL